MAKVKIIEFPVDELVQEISKTYQITEDGRCINKKRNSVLSFPLNYKGYPSTRLWCPNLSKHKDKRIAFRMHRLVAMFHLPNYSKELQVNHKNGIKTDNRVENLEMVTCKQNMIHAWNVLETNKQRRINVGIWRKGTKHTEEAKKKIGLANSIARTGTKHTEESKEKMRIASREVWKKRKLKTNQTKKI